MEQEKLRLQPENGALPLRNTSNAGSEGNRDCWRLGVLSFTEEAYILGFWGRPRPCKGGLGLCCPSCHKVEALKLHHGDLGLPTWSRGCRILRKKGLGLDISIRARGKGRIPSHPRVWGQRLCLNFSHCSTLSIVIKRIMLKTIQPSHIKYKSFLSDWAVVAHAFIPRSWEAEVDRSL